MALLTATFCWELKTKRIGNLPCFTVGQVERMSVMDALTQKSKILRYCEENGSITVREAFEKLHINSPTKRISEIRQAGYDVQTVMERRQNASGNEVKYTRYYINGGTENGNTHFAQ